MKEELLKKLDLAVILTLFIGVSYALTYSYHIGRLFHYNIPYDFLEISNKDIVLTTMTLSPIILYIFWSLNMELKSDTTKVEDHSNIKIKISTVETLLNDNEERLRNKEVELEEIKENLTLVQTRLSLLNYQNDDVEKHQKMLEKNLEIVKKIENEIEAIKNDQYVDKIALKKLNHNYFKKRINNLIIIFIIVLTIGLLLSTFFLFKNSLYYFLVINIIGNLLIYSGIYILNKRQKYGILAFFIALMLIIYSFVFGFFGSNINKKYISFELEDETYVVLATYKEKYIYVPLKDKVDNAYDTFNLIDTSDVEIFSVKKIE